MLEKQLEILEDNTFTHSISRNLHLETVLNALDKVDNVSVLVLERILEICVRDLEEDSRVAVLCLNIISKILNKYQSERPYCHTSKLMASAEAVLNFILTAASLNKAESLQTVSFNTLLAYPDDVLAELASTCDDVYELFNLYCHMKMPVEIRFKPNYLAHKVMNNLTPDQKVSFVKKGIAVWFSKVIPCAMNCFQTQIISASPMILMLIELLEMLTEQLVTIDYSNNPQWQIVLDNIYSPHAYPAQMKDLLTSGSVLWHRIWIIFIKLLKAQITINKPGVGSPINSMLPVVEMAFKMDFKSRCKAFQCWNVLIDNFSSETNELFVNKRIKLLIIPLRSNNAKVEETALAKLDTWWHLIKQYETRIDDKILYPFLYFCFGRHVPEKTALIPGTISPAIKKKCVEAFVEMVGHVKCKGCVSMPRLKNKLINTKVLVDHWTDWTHSLKMAIKASAEEDVGIGKQPITCTWKSFVMTIAEIPENNIRKDLINDLLTITKLLAQESTSNSKLADIVNNVLIASILEETPLKQLLQTDEFLNGPIQNIISILIDPAFSETCEKHSSKSVMLNLKLTTENLVQQAILAEKAIKWLIKDVTPNDQSLCLWTSLAEALQVSQTRHEYLQQMCNMLLWPLLNLHHFKNVDTAALTWNSTYCVMHLTTMHTVWFHLEVDRILLENQNKGPTVTFFMLCVLLAVIKAKIITKTFEGINTKIKLLQDVMCKYNDYNEVSLVFPILIDTMDLLATVAVNTENVENIFLFGNKILNILNKHLEGGETTDGVIIAKFMDAFEHLLKTESGKEFKILVLDELLKCRSLITTKTVPSSLDSMLKSVMADKNIDQSVRGKIKASLDISEDHRSNDLECPKINMPKTNDQDENKFTTPVTKNTKKGPKKKETSIVNTVVENGEEFAVIKSNWKFNPRKLTENQKEKLQRKREDIPALYQDLSQSQDEFKLKSWKTDSQDASTTNSRSGSAPSNDNISTLKNMPGTDIVPKMIDSLFSDIPNGPTEKNENKETDSPKSNNVDQAKSSPSVKIPRMALKDRVSRNVRILIEKSTVSKEGPQNNDILNQTVTANTFNTPVTKCKDTKNVVNSAPSKINVDRPARVKRKPKKFDDSELFLLKKRRNSVSQNDSQSLDMDASEDVASLPEKDNKDVNNILKVATVSVKNIDGDTSEARNSNAPINDRGFDNDVKEVDGGEKKQVVADVSSLSVEKTVDLNTANDIPNENLEDNDKCPQIETSVDKSLEDTPEQEKEASRGNTSTPNNITKRKDSDETKSTTKKKSRIENQLAIDMVEGHPFLKLQTEKRVTRKCLTTTPNSSRKIRVNDKLNKSKTDPKSASKPKKATNNSQPPNEKPRKNGKDTGKSSITVSETQDISPDATQDLSEDVIESSQDTTTTISVKSFRSCVKKRSGSAESVEKSAVETQDLVDNTQEINTTADVVMSQENKDDSEFPANKTEQQEGMILDLTEEMDTEPTSSGNVIIINDDDPVIDLNTECEPCPGPDTLELANADTQPTDPSPSVSEIETSHYDIPENKTNEQIESRTDESQLTSSAGDRTITLVDISQNEETGASSPTKDDDQRKKDFLNNTSEISPIKSLSPIEPKSLPASETSSDFLVIKLSGPVQINGEPLEMSNSPEIFTEDKISPDKRDQSPPRSEVTATNSSPSSSLSLKKNRPQVRSGGRAAQMLGLCVPDRLQTIKHVDRPDTEGPKKSSPVNTPARRNLRMLYQTAVDSDNSDEKEESQNFLMFKKTLPPADCSPAGPILKRKLADIADEATVSPANKRKRVSFHDPVSTSVSVQKYIETSAVRSPQNSALKRLERQLRHQSPMKSPKRLDSLFKLDSVLTKAIESFENDVTSSNDTELSSLDQTPAVEVVKTSELNDIDHIFPDLIECKDSIDNIASELSSPAMRLLLVKELEGKIETVGDLARLTELEVNRICIKAPKVQVVKKVLADYAARKDKIMEVEKENKAARKDLIMEADKENKRVNEPPVTVVTEVETNTVAMQTNILMSETETQTSVILQRLSSTQTDELMTLQTSTQTDESGSKSTEDIINSCLKDRKDFIPKIRERVVETLHVKDCTDLLLKKMTSADAKSVFNSVIQRECELHSNGLNGNKELSFLQNYLCDTFDVKDLILFCSQLMQRLYDKSNVDKNV